MKEINDDILEYYPKDFLKIIFLNKKNIELYYNNINNIDLN